MNDVYKHFADPANGREPKEAHKFAMWVVEVDNRVKDRTEGLGILDLPDVDYTSMYDDELTPELAAEAVLIEAGYLEDDEYEY